MTGRSQIGPALTQPTRQEQREISHYHVLLGKKLAAFTKGHDAAKEVYKAIAHALLYRAQYHGIPTADLLGFLRALIPQYLPKGSQLNMAPELRERLEKSAGMPQWPSDVERERINAVLGIIYKETQNVPVYVQVRIYWHLLMVNAEPMGMTHPAVLLRLEVLDRMQRADGAPHKLMPSTPPIWAQTKRG